MGGSTSMVSVGHGAPKARRSCGGSKGYPPENFWEVKAESWHLEVFVALFSCQNQITFFLKPCVRSLKGSLCIVNTGNAQGALTKTPPRNIELPKPVICVLTYVVCLMMKEIQATAFTDSIQQATFTTTWHPVTEIWVNLGPGNGLLPDGTKPLPEPMLTDHQWSPMTFILGQFQKRCLNHQSLKSVWKLYI